MVIYSQACEFFIYSFNVFTNISRMFSKHFFIMAILVSRWILYRLCYHVWIFKSSHNSSLSLDDLWRRFSMLINLRACLQWFDINANRLIDISLYFVFLCFNVCKHFVRWEFISSFLAYGKISRSQFHRKLSSQKMDTILFIGSELIIACFVSDIKTPASYFLFFQAELKIHFESMFEKQNFHLVNMKSLGS